MYRTNLKQANEVGVPFYDILSDTFYPASPSTSPIATLTGFGNPYGMAVVGDCLYVAITDTFPGEVKKIDIATGSVVATVTVGNDPRGLYWDGAYLWCANYDLNKVGTANTVSKIDVTTDTVVATITVGLNPAIIEGDRDGGVWVACFGTTYAYRIDKATNAVTSVNIGVKTKGVAYDDRAYMIFTSGDTSEIKRVRTTNISLVYTNAMPTTTYGVCTYGENIYITGFNSDMYRYNRRATSGAATIAIGATPSRRPAIDDKAIWIPCGSSGKTVVYDLALNQVMLTLNLGLGSHKCVAFHGDKAFIAVDNAIAVIANP